MKTFIFDNNCCFDMCEHLEYTKEKGFNVRTYDESFPIGIDKDVKEHILFLCMACGERIERKMTLNFISNLKLVLHINGSEIKLFTKNAWNMIMRLWDKNER